MGRNVEAIEVTLLKPWMAWPVGKTHNLIKAKAEDLIKKGIAEATNPPKPKTPKKNRAIGNTVTK